MTDVVGLAGAGAPGDCSKRWGVASFSFKKVSRLPGAGQTPQIGHLRTNMIDEKVQPTKTSLCLQTANDQPVRSSCHQAACKVPCAATQQVYVAMRRAQLLERDETIRAAAAPMVPPKQGGAPAFAAGLAAAAATAAPVVLPPANHDRR